MKDLMKEMGFRTNATKSAKEAFLKNLIKNATGVEYQTPSERAEIKKDKTLVQRSEEQLCFGIEEKDEKSRPKSA